MAAGMGMEWVVAADGKWAEGKTGAPEGLSFLPPCRLVATKVPALWRRVLLIVGSVKAVPIVNIIMLYVLPFSSWPILWENKSK